MNKYIKIPEWIKPLASAFQNAGIDLYIVGGYVRNMLLGLPYTDIDICSSALPEQAARLARAAGFKAKDRHVKMGTLDILINTHGAEYTPFRTESYGDGGSHRPDWVSFTDDIALDAIRRDFRCNAIYANALTGSIIDPLGGYDDIERRLLTACKENPMETLKDDGLRLLRLARFAGQLGFSISPALLHAARMSANNISDIAAERIAPELSQICLADAKYGCDWHGIEAHYRALRILDAIGVLGLLYPELMEGKGVGQITQYHAYDVFNHNMHVFQMSLPKLELRLASILHDVAKPRQAAINKGGKMYGHDEVGAVMARKMLMRTGFGKAVADRVCSLIAQHMFDLDGKAKVGTCRKRFANWSFDFTRDLIAMREADIKGSGRLPSDGHTPEKWLLILEQMIYEGAIDNIADLAINGDAIMEAVGINEGKMVGRIKRFLFDRVALHPSLNKPDLLINEARRYYASTRELI